DVEYSGNILFENKDIKQLNLFEKYFSLVNQGYLVIDTVSVRKNISLAYENSFTFIEDYYLNRVKDLPDYNEIKKLPISQIPRVVDKKTKEKKYEISKKDFINKEVEKVANKLGILDQLDKKPSSLSSGQRQRLAISMAVIKKPKLILMDEPFSSLDTSSIRDIIYLMKKLKNELKVSFLVITHKQSFIEMYSDKIVYLSNTHAYTGNNKLEILEKLEKTNSSELEKGKLFFDISFQKIPGRLVNSNEESIGLSSNSILHKANKDGKWRLEKSVFKDNKYTHYFYCEGYTIIAKDNESLKEEYFDIEVISDKG
ncbi:MAG: ATP-binding cassette domain-containing protein, partial [Mycoplasmataceae bacterium]|nr:ATP-binding cassette domain-containing protein [Mycoplasmataceae bacterium]